MSACKFCGAEIDWITNLEGKQVPVDPDPVFVIEGDGREAFLDDMGATITGRQARPEEERRDLHVAFIPHRRTCWRVDEVPPAIRSIAEGLIEVSQEYEAAMRRCKDVVDKLGEDVEQMKREADMLAAASAMTVAAAMYHVAARRFHEAQKQNGGGGGGRFLPAT